MRVGVTGATGLLGTRLVKTLSERSDTPVAFSRDRERAQERLGVQAVTWNPADVPAPAEALSGLDAVVNLAGEPVAQRWTAAAKERIRSSRVVGTQNLIESLAAASPRPQLLVSASAVGYYGDRGSQELDEDSGHGSDFLASVCADWEAAAERASSELGVRVVRVRIGVVLDRSGGALQKLLPVFRIGAGGPVAGGRQYMPWVSIDDVVGIILEALSQPSWSGAVNACAPSSATNAEFSRTLGHVLNRPAVLPAPAFALRAMFGEMASTVIGSQRVVPRRTLELGYRFRYPELEPALRAALG